MTTASTVPSHVPATAPVVVPQGQLELLLQDLAEEAVEQRWTENGERAGDLVLSATTALQDGQLEHAIVLALRAGRLLGSSLVSGIAA